MEPERISLKSNNTVAPIEKQPRQFDKTEVRPLSSKQQKKTHTFLKKYA